MEKRAIFLTMKRNSASIRHIKREIALDHLQKYTKIAKYIRTLMDASFALRLSLSLSAPMLFLVLLFPVAATVLYHEKSQTALILLLLACPTSLN